MQDFRRPKIQMRFIDAILLQDKKACPLHSISQHIAVTIPIIRDAYQYLCYHGIYIVFPMV